MTGQNFKNLYRSETFKTPQTSKPVNLNFDET